VPGLTLERVKVDTKWRPQAYIASGKQLGVLPEVLKNAVAQTTAFVTTRPGHQPILTLKHLAQLSDVDYAFLRRVVGRREIGDYACFRVRKQRASGTKVEFRIICVPCEPLMRVQRWIAQNILREQPVHPASFAYSPESQISAAAKVHLGARWLIKTDIRRFFESISEIQAYRVFRQLGYQPLVSFELARIVTRQGPKPWRQQPQWHGSAHQYQTIEAYQAARLGHLPQGAPTSPMLSNLVAVALDERVAAIAQSYDLLHTRYADDICLSTASRQFTRRRAKAVIGQLYRAMAEFGFSPNVSKTQVVPPGARKVVLGLLVDTQRPRLSRPFKDELRRHVHFLTHPEVGVARHAARRGFASTIGLRNHLYGLLAHAGSVEPEFADALREELSQVDWPL
jgi:RNA-directed DNA polymerase